MANENLKKFLDQQGVSTLWSKIAAKITEEEAARAAAIKAEKERAEAAELVLADKIGELPADIADVVSYVNKKTEGIATDTALAELQGSVNTISGDVTTIKGDYLKSADKTELSNAIAAEATRADTAEKANANAIKAIADNYLKNADKEELQANIDTVAEDVADIVKDYLTSIDKTELEGKIALKADKTALDTVSAVANAAATQTALQGEIDRAKGEEARIEGLVTAEAERAAQVEADLQTQINTIMNNPDTEGVINSINEFTQYIADHGEIAEGFRTDIDANARAIEDHETLAAQTYETKVDATTKYDELVALVDEKAVQADWEQNDSDAANYIKNRPFYAVEGVLGDVVFDDTVNDFSLNEEVGYYQNGDLYIDGYFNVDTTYEIVFDGKTYTSVCKENYYPYIGNKSGVTGDYPFSIYSAYTGYDYVLRISTATPGPHTIKISTVIEPSTLVQLDEKFIPDTIARVTDVNALNNAVTTAVANNAAAIEELQGLVGDGSSVQEQITNAIASIPQVDWNQLDSTAADYIKNKPFGEYVSNYTVLKHEKSINVDDSLRYTDYDYITLDKGIYQIIWDGVIYDNIVCSHGGSIGGDGYPFRISEGSMGAMNYYADTPGNHIVSIWKANTFIDHIEEKFIHPDIARRAYVDETVGAAETRISALEELVGDESVAAQIEAAVKVNSDAITEMKNGTAINTFAGVETALAGKQDIIAANTYDVYGAAADALTNANEYTDAGLANIQALTIAEIEAAIASASVTA